MNDDDRLIYGEWDGLTAQERAAIEERLRTDPALRAKRERAESLRAELRALGPSQFEPRGPAFDLERFARSAPPVDLPSRASSTPYWMAAAAALLLGVAGAAWWIGAADDAVAPPAAPIAQAPEAPKATPEVLPEATPPSDITVAFQLRAPEAQAVTVAGDFNDWKPETLSMQRGTDGLWTAQAALPPGRYAYMYVVDGQWLTPPDARRTQDDGFGAQNGVLDLLQPSDV